MIFLRDPQIKVEKGPNRLTIEFKSNRVARIVSAIIGPLPLLLALVGVLSLFSISGSGRIFMLCMLLPIGALGTYGSYMALFLNFSKVRIEAEKSEVTRSIKPFPVPGQSVWRSENIKQFFAATASSNSLGTLWTIKIFKLMERLKILLAQSQAQLLQ